MADRKPHKVIVCGSRSYPDRTKVFHVLDAYHARIGPDMYIVAGGADGADEFAREWAVSRRVDHEIRYAKWEVEGKPAGILRNRRMAKRKPRLVLAFSLDFDKSIGTSDMIRVAEKSEIKVKRFS